MYATGLSWFFAPVFHPLPYDCTSQAMIFAEWGVCWLWCRLRCRLTAFRARLMCSLHLLASSRHYLYHMAVTIRNEPGGANESPWVVCQGTAARRILRGTTAILIVFILDNAKPLYDIAVYCTTVDGDRQNSWATIDFSQHLANLKVQAMENGHDLLESEAKAILNIMCRSASIK